MVKNIAHRGFSGRYPENTLLAFQKALEVGADGIELDVHLTKDNILVIIHDERLDRTTDGCGLVKEHTYAQLRKLDASATYQGMYGRSSIPTLEQYFELIQGWNGLTNIELKNSIIDYEGIEEQVLKLVERYGRKKDCIFSSFNHLSIQRIKALAPEVRCGFLEESRMIDPAEYCIRYGVEFWHPFCYSMTDDIIAQLKAVGIGINVWTANTREEMEEMLRQGVDGVITNFPDLFGEVCQEWSNRD